MSQIACSPTKPNQKRKKKERASQSHNKQSTHHQKNTSTCACHRMCLPVSARGSVADVHHDGGHLEVIAVWILLVLNHRRQREPRHVGAKLLLRHALHELFELHWHAGLDLVRL